MTVFAAKTVEEKLQSLKYWKVAPKSASLELKWMIVCYGPIECNHELIIHYSSIMGDQAFKNVGLEMKEGISYHRVCSVFFAPRCLIENPSWKHI